ncbi:hypothetical protein ACYSNW_16310 [Enterococcus sp. LJL99]
MNYLLTFELKKFLINAKNVFLLFIPFLFLLYSVYQLNSNHNQAVKDLENEYYEQYHTLFSKQQLIYGALTEHRSQDDFFDAEKKLTDSELTQLLNNFETSIKNLNDYSLTFSEKNWEASLQSQNRYVKSLLDILKTGMILENTYTEEQVQRVVTENEFFLTNKIKPDTALYGYSGFGLTLNTMKWTMSIYGVVFLSILFFDLYWQEYEKKTIRFLHSLPINKEEIRKKKYQLSWLIVMNYIVFLLLISWLIGSLFWGDTGTFSYPVSLLMNDKIEILQLWKTIVIAIVLYASFSGVILTIIKYSSLYGNTLENTLLSTLSIVTVPCLITNVFKTDSVVNYFNPFNNNQLIDSMIVAFNNGNFFLYVLISFIILSIMNIGSYLLKGVIK